MAPPLLLLMPNNTNLSSQSFRSQSERRSSFSLLFPMDSKPSSSIGTVIAFATAGAVVTIQSAIIANLYRKCANLTRTVENLHKENEQTALLLRNEIVVLRDSVTSLERRIANVRMQLLSSGPAEESTSKRVRSVDSTSEEGEYVDAVGDGPELSEERRPLLMEGLRSVQRGEVQFRKSRAETCGCESDQDFAAKLFCVRLAFRQIMDEPQTMQWLIQSARIIIADLLRHNRKDPADFFVVYDRMTAYLLDEKNYATTCEELQQRKVFVVNLWDVMFDMVILDSLEEILKPPTGIAATIRNGLMSTSMKESVLNSVVWSVIKAKRQRLQVNDGFIARFYDISQVLITPLTMGLLGGSGVEFQELCVYFKEQICGFVSDIYNPSKVRYTTAIELTEDVKKLLTDRIELLKVKLSNELLPV